MQRLQRLEGGLSNRSTMHRYSRLYSHQLEKNNQPQLLFATVSDRHHKEMAMCSASSTCCPTALPASDHQALKRIMAMRYTRHPARSLPEPSIAHYHEHHSPPVSATSWTLSSQHQESESARTTKSAHLAAQRSYSLHLHSYEGSHTQWRRLRRMKATQCCHRAG